MSKIAVKLLLSVAMLVCALPVYGQRASLADSMPSHRVLSRYNLERAWWSYATIDSTRETVKYLTADEELLYLQTSGGVITAFNAETGQKLWATQLGFKDRPAFPATSNDEMVLIASGMELYAFSKWTGKLEWKIKLPKHPSTSPTIDDANVYIGAIDGSVFAFDLKKINELYAENLLPDWSFQSQLWRYKTPKEITTPPVSNGRLVAFASSDGSLFSVSTQDRKQRFQLETAKPISAPMSQSGEYLYLASENFILYCLDIQNGQTRWEFVSGYPMKKQPRLIGEQIFLTPVMGGMFSLSKETGEQQWWRPKVTEFLAASPKRIYASDSQGNLLILDRKNGGLFGSIPMRKFSKRISNDRSDRLFMATASGLVMSIKEPGIEFPLYYKFPEKRPLVPIIVPDNEKPEKTEKPPEKPPEN